MPGVIADDGRSRPAAGLELGVDTVNAAGGTIVQTRGVVDPSHDLLGTFRDGGSVKIESQHGA